MSDLHSSSPDSAAASQYADSFGFQWNIHTKTQLDSFTGLSLSRDRLAAALGGSIDVSGLKVLEAGSGAGRFTEVLAQAGADLTTFDASAAVTANRKNNDRYPNVKFYQADIFDPPFPQQSFDLVICLGVVQHTPDPLGAIASLARFVKPGGRLVVDCYAWNLRSLLHWKYVLRPLTKRMPANTLYKLLNTVVPPMVPLSAWLRRHLGPAGMRIVPILQYEHWGIPPDLNRAWAVLDTFDMLSPTFDNPQTLSGVRGAFERAGFERLNVRYGANGVVASGYKPSAA